MSFKEFSEFENPESADYDINSSIKNVTVDDRSGYKSPSKEEKEFLELYFNLGCPELFELEPFGLTEQEFSHPTSETIKKLKKYAESYQEINTHKSR